MSYQLSVISDQLSDVSFQFTDCWLLFTDSLIYAPFSCQDSFLFRGCHHGDRTDSKSAHLSINFTLVGDLCGSNLSLIRHLANVVTSG
ncbi:MAG: hypothetical protein EWV41_03740 [Microcystis wesenbergii Mw_MB_S_20031200_S109]|uniref:Uncharacterized protein n=1 Tax=Microcystis wesenbergii Mw_MB_S_20031200_S109D TaxID=2486241 RepID=A0A552LEV7_9CHRO|nr:MAG: hypothetical protein EWV41_03740 [Microcystis wesenbergii Mw_MB_S_20031200_S109]TRV18748.1 MAG: hypothetical protein EWV88_19785 [Microcystis wesenbergii Mw_MB_S_20031200_S109D]